MNRSKHHDWGKAGGILRAAAVLVLAGGLLFGARGAACAEPGAGGVGFRWGGEVKAIGAASWPGSGTLIQPQGDKTFFDGLVEGRLKGHLFLSEWANLEAHLVVGASGGDTRDAVSDSAFPLYLGRGDIPGSPPQDDRQLIDMSWTPVDSDDFVLYSRVDRLALTVENDSALLRLGRQAVTWGDGMIFNPMDLINPFSPTDVVRDYKVGQDMVFAQAAAGSTANLQFLYAPRRNPVTDEVTWDESAIAGKFHFALGETEFDIMAAENFGDQVVGAGSRGYLGSAGWRADVTWTRIEDDGSDYLSAVANLDYAWQWWGRNWYGVVEVFYSGIGNDDYAEAIEDPDIQKQIYDGMLFTLAQWYADATVRLELHPLLNTYLTVISNVDDPSFILQPKVSWDVAKDLRLTVWGNIGLGRDGTEYGGFEVPGTGLERKPPDAVFAWLNYYF